MKWRWASLTPTNISVRAQDFTNQVPSLWELHQYMIWCISCVYVAKTGLCGHKSPILSMYFPLWPDISQEQPETKLESHLSSLPTLPPQVWWLNDTTGHDGLNPKHPAFFSSDDDSISAINSMCFSNKAKKITVKQPQMWHNLEELPAALVWLSSRLSR